jgi:hypothetical protein
MTKARSLAVAAVICAGLGMVLAGPWFAVAGAATSPPRPQALLSPDSGAWLGAFVNEDGIRTNEGYEAGVTSLETGIGRQLGIDHHYIEFFQPIAGPLVLSDIEHGRVPMVSWGGTDATRIASGVHDEWIRKEALGVKALRRPILLRFGWEMERPQLGWVHSASDFIAAWRHLHDIFQQEGVTNAAWVWCPMSVSFRSGVAQQYYPGAQYVDWIGADGYNWAPGREGAIWRSFKSVFQEFYDWGVTTGKPLLIGETGAQERSPGEKAAWIDDMATTLRHDFGNIEALVYFDAFPRYDWRLMNASPASLDAFKAMGAESYFSPTPPSPAVPATTQTAAVKQPGAADDPTSSTAWYVWLGLAGVVAVAGAVAAGGWRRRRHAR